MSNANICSMTAFSRKEASHDWGTLSWEIRSVNHRYLEASYRLPEAARSLEPTLRDIIRKQLQRGKVDCSLQLRLNTVASKNLQINDQVLDQYLAAINTINERIAHQSADPAPVNGMDLLFRPGVIEQNELDNEEINKIALTLFHETLVEHIAHRKREGAELANFIQQRLAKIVDYVKQLRPMIPAIVQQQKEKLQARLSELKGDLDNNRVEQEIALLAQRLDVDEELDRLSTHVAEVNRALNDKGGVGRRLDFLMQELNREVNTLSSKSTATDTTLIAVDMKVLIEQMREQVQNIE
jgi:uncharacterized protein (TIGR00255 family)